MALEIKKRKNNNIVKRLFDQLVFINFNFISNWPWWNMVFNSAATMNERYQLAFGIRQFVQVRRTHRIWMHDVKPNIVHTHQIEMNSLFRNKIIDPRSIRRTEHELVLLSRTHRRPRVIVLKCNYIFIRRWAAIFRPERIYWRVRYASHIRRSWIEMHVTRSNGALPVHVGNVPKIAHSIINKYEKRWRVSVLCLLLRQPHRNRAHMTDEHTLAQLKCFRRFGGTCAFFVN